MEVYFKCVSITKGLYSVTTGCLTEVTTQMFSSCSIVLLLWILSATCTCRLIDFVVWTQTLCLPSGERVVGVSNCGLRLVLESGNLHTTTPAILHSCVGPPVPVHMYMYFDLLLSCPTYQP